jgi:hypothetical protein
MKPKNTGKTLNSATFQGKTIKIGDKLPVPTPKLVIRPTSWVDDPAKSPTGVFRSRSGS